MRSGVLVCSQVLLMDSAPYVLQVRDEKAWVESGALEAVWVQLVASVFSPLWVNGAKSVCWETPEGWYRIVPDPNWQPKRIPRRKPQE
jgi:hypothetical protein